MPILVHVATNDLDVNYVEDQQMVWKLRALKPELAETKIYVDPAPWGSSGGHAFSRRVDPNTLERVDSPEQIDSWNRTWVFFEWWLRPYVGNRESAGTGNREPWPTGELSLGVILSEAKDPRGPVRGPSIGMMRIPRSRSE